MKPKKLSLLLLVMVLLLGSCSKSFLDEKPNSGIIAPTTLEQLRSMLENSNAINTTGGLPQISADEYNVISDQNYNALPTAIQRNAYRWKADLYEGEEVRDWNSAYTQILYANSVLDVLEEKQFPDQLESNRLKGRALFIRAHAYFDLAKNFCKVYRPASAETDLGLPLRLSAAVELIQSRSSMRVLFDQMIKDLKTAAQLLEPSVPEKNKNRPSKVAAMALLSRLFLYMGDYGQAELYADTAISSGPGLMDYNTVSRTSDTPFDIHAPEVIYQCSQIFSYSETSMTRTWEDYEVKPELYQMFASNDLRKDIFFLSNAIGRINMKRGYIGSGVYPFTGLAMDEVVLIKAECLARRNAVESAMALLNQMLLKRYRTGTFVPLSAVSPEDALVLVLQERRKELIWRGIRWLDLKRLNRDGANITLSRTIAGTVYTLPPNDPKYVFPIPDQEITLSNIQQNER